MGRVTNKPAAVLGDLNPSDALYVVDVNGVTKDKKLTLGVTVEYVGENLPADGVGGFVRLDGSGYLPTLDGRNLINLPAGDDSGAVLSVAGRVGNVSLQIDDIADLPGALAGAATSGHTHDIADTAGLQAALDAKVATAALHEAVDDRVAALVVAGDNITVTYDDVAGMLRFDAAPGGVSNWGDLTGKPAALDAIDGLTPAAGKLLHYTGEASADLVDAGAGGLAVLAAADPAAVRTAIGGIDPRTAAAFTTANPVLAVNVLGIETDTRLMKRGDGATAWTALAYTAISASEMIARLSAVQAAGGATESSLKALITYFADGGGVNLPVPTNADAWDGPAGELIFATMEVLRTSAAAVAMTVTAGTPDTSPLAGTAGFLRTLALVGDTDVNAIALAGDERERWIVASASGGDWWLTFTAADQLYGMPGGGVMVRSGTNALVSVRMVESSVQVTLLSRTGDPDADVTVTLSAGDLAVDARKGHQQRLLMAGNAALVAPAFLSGKWLDLRAVATGGARTISTPGFDAARRYGIGTDGTLAVASGEAALLRMRQSSAGPEIWYAGGAASGRLVPVFVAGTNLATRRNQTGGALTPDNTVNGDVAVLFDGRTGTAIPDLVTGFTSLLTASITNQCAMRVSYKALTAGEQIPATVNGTRRLVLIYRDVDTAAPILGTPQIGSGTSASPVIPGQTLPNEGLVLGGWISGGTQDLIFTAPLVERGIVGGTNNPVQVADSNGGVSTFAQQTYTVTSTPWIGFSLALLGKVG